MPEAPVDKNRQSYFTAQIVYEIHKASLRCELISILLACYFGVNGMLNLFPVDFNTRMI